MPYSKAKLLIVDDEPSTLTLLSHIFAQQGYTVRCALDGFSALKQMREEMPDVLLSDLNMPGMSGFELLSIVRRRLPAIYVIASSGAFLGDDIPHGIAADAFYEKASNLNLLLKIMDTATQALKRSLHRSGALVPMWIPSNGKNHSGVCMISCPECMRTFPHVLSGTGLVIQEADCTHCHTLVHYAIVHPTAAVLTHVPQAKPASAPLQAKPIVPAPFTESDMKATGIN